MRGYITLTAALALCSLTSCNGLFGNIYDEPATSEIPDEGLFTKTSNHNRLTLKLDASSFDSWNYISLKNKTVEKLPIPLACEGEWDGRSSITYNEIKGSDATYLSSIPTDAQAEPEAWDFAIHRFDVRTNEGAACATELHSLDDVADLDMKKLTFTPDTWSTADIMIDLKDMMAYRIGFQNSMVNPVLSEWVKMDISTPPPVYTATGKVYLLQLADGSTAAMQMTSYMNAKGEKGHLTIDILYPL